jgi:hypothetical protein
MVVSTTARDKFPADRVGRHARQKWSSNLEHLDAPNGTGPGLDGKRGWAELRHLRETVTSGTRLHSIFDSSDSHKLLHTTLRRKATGVRARRAGSASTMSAMIKFAQVDRRTTTAQSGMRDGLGRIVVACGRRAGAYWRIVIAYRRRAGADGRRAGAQIRMRVAPPEIAVAHSKSGAHAFG